MYVFFRNSLTSKIPQFSVSWIPRKIFLKNTPARVLLTFIVKLKYFTKSEIAIFKFTHKIWSFSFFENFSEFLLLINCTSHFFPDKLKKCYICLTKIVNLMLAYFSNTSFWRLFKSQAFAMFLYKCSGFNVLKWKQNSNGVYL